MFVADIKSIKVKLASPQDITGWCNGEVKKPETINYRTQRPEKDGLFCEKIFGPVKDYRCACGKYRGIRYKGQVCDRCGVEITSATVRRDRMGYIKLAAPVSHIWFLRSIPSIMGMVLNIPQQSLEKVVYFAGYIVTECREDEKKKVLKEIEEEFQNKLKEFQNSAKESKLSKKDQESFLFELKEAKDKALNELKSIELFKVFSEKQYSHLAMKYGEVFEAGTGAEVLRKLFEKVDLKNLVKNLEKKIEEMEGADKKKALLRLRILRGMAKNGVRPEWMFMTVLPVLPPSLRPMVQLDGERYASSDLNDLYRRVINRNNRLKYLLEIDAPEVIVRNEKRMLQEAVDALIDNGMRKSQTTTMATTGGKRNLKSLSDMLKGKKGRFRQNLLGKRVDYSGRSVIASGPNLAMNYCGLPKTMALELFKPFVIAKLLEKGIAYNIRGASRLIEDKTEDIWEALEEVVANKVVLINRAPTLHRLSVQGFYPILIEDKVIRIHPLVCEAFNADFDGDQMAVHLPLSTKAQQEARELMLSGNNLLKPATGKPVINLRLEMVLGCYWLTSIKEKAKGEGKIFASKNEAILAYDSNIVDLRAKIKVRIDKDIIETTVGRILFNNALPEGYKFFNDTADKGKITKLTGDIIHHFDNETANKTIDKMKNLGFEYATLSGTSWGMDDLILPKEKSEMIAQAEKKVEQIEDFYQKGLLSPEEKSVQIIQVWQETKDELEHKIPGLLPKDGPVWTIVDSGSRGSWAQPVQMAGMKGLVINALGQTMELPVKSSFKEGLKVLEYFISTHGARKGTSDTALRTAAAGYLTRRLVDVGHGILIREEDCQDKTGTILYKKDSDSINQDFKYKIIGRICLEDVPGVIKSGQMIGMEEAAKIVEKGIEKLTVRTPLSCKCTKGICQKCYGWDLGNNKMIGIGQAVGIVAAQAIGEPGTQLTLKTFHSGGVAGVSDITQGLPRVEEILEGRIPKGKAVLSTVQGVVKEIVASEKQKIIRIKPEKKDDLIEFEIPSHRGVWVQKGDVIEKGQQLCEGSIDFKELFKLTGKETTLKAIIKEIQSIYVSQGVNIHDKHVEIIIGQMFARVKIKDPDNSEFSIGEVIDEKVLIEINKQRRKDKEKEIKYDDLFLGISAVSLTSGSWLSSASFEQTSRVLIRAAIDGREDKLEGLKENVIIGKLIPAGTAYDIQPEDSQDTDD
ncbi:MAG TPA: DNA-directed RNA polymerase subunit beta' [Candidatus Pacearchaeota archaeon]|mgnify:CR=1 FL=1|nr:DNA-directed RNA polymerase subunit beta' [Candidatus Pacearchaeota archaeon]HPM08409.1 DNA-directed RNA polymerase subunit beta' [Candidatus Pacearchaeota archaeon]HQI74508.1 DNA-directed RNA polymerase subunit beta' [Candidatus Pacearchaeota archaeon]